MACGFDLMIFLISVQLLVVQILLVKGQTSQSVPVVVPHVGVIGAGIGGTTTCLYLSELFGKDDIEIDVYEKGKVGGRAAVVDVGKKTFEAGASIIHARNRYLSDLAISLGLKHKVGQSSRLSIFNGAAYVFQESEYKLITYAELLWRYGWSILRWESLIEEMLYKFERIYKHQDNGYSFTSVEKLLHAMDPSFVNLTQMNTSEFLQEIGFNQRFIDELATAVTRVNYGQTPVVNGFVGAVALAGAQATLWSVEGGNYKLAEGALKKSGAKIIHSEAESIALKDGKYVVTSSYTENDEKKIREKIYDIIIVAAPQTADLATIKFEDFPHIHDEFPGHYHRTVTTFIQGQVNNSYFGFNRDHEIGDIVTINTSLHYNSLSKNYPVQGTTSLPPVWKMFSQSPLPKDDLKQMFSNIKTAKTVDWLAYPEYQPPQKLGLFQLHDRLYYTSSIEWAASAMEMSAVSGRNAALMAYNHWFKRLEKIDRHEFPDESEIPNTVNEEL